MHILIWFSPIVIKNNLSGHLNVSCNFLTFQVSKTYASLEGYMMKHFLEMKSSNKYELKIIFNLKVYEISKCPKFELESKNWILILKDFNFIDIFIESKWDNNFQ